MDYDVMLHLGLVVFGAVAIDMALGDPRNRYHPTAWVGGLMARMISFSAGRGFWAQRLGGVAAVAAPACAAVALLLPLHYAVGHALAALGWDAAAAAGTATDPAQYVYAAVLVAACCVLLKCTIAVRGMQEHAYAVVESLEGEGGVAGARSSLSMIVKRKTGSLDEEHVISGVLESIGENTVDGATGSLFYYGLFGLPGAFAHRIVNTADSMAGYRGEMLGRLGWFAAHADTILNYVPARLTGIAMVVASAALGHDWRGALRSMVRDGGSTASRNSGYPMAALAGALNVRLEKEGHYVLCSGGRAPSTCDVRRAVSLMKATVLVFAAGMVVPAGVASGAVAGMILGAGGA